MGIKMKKKMIPVLLLPVLILAVLLSAAALVLADRLNERLDMLALRLRELEQTTAGLQKQQEAFDEGEGREEETGLMPGSAETADAEEGNNRHKEASGNNAETDAQTEGEKALKEEPAHRVYLTFDDGPSIYTEDILDILDRYEVKATFFVTGRESKADEEMIREIADRGHSLGMHSYSHKYSEIYASEEAFAQDFEKIRDWLFEITGTESKIYRFPGGSSNTISDIPMERFAEYLEEQGVRFYDWNASSGDGGSISPDTDTLVENSTGKVKDRKNTVILMHDSAGKRNTVEALPSVIENILKVEDAVILPITEDTEPVQHIKIKSGAGTVPVTGKSK